jgi:hypothetical protein
MLRLTNTMDWEEVLKRGCEHAKNVYGMKDEDFTS